MGGAAFDTGPNLTTKELPKNLTQVNLQLRYHHFGDQYLDSTKLESIDPSEIDAIYGSIGIKHYFENGWSATLDIPSTWLKFKPGAGFNPEYMSGMGDITAGANYNFAEITGVGVGKLIPSIGLSLGLPTGRVDTFDTNEEYGAINETQQGASGFGAFSAGLIGNTTLFIHQQIALVAGAGVMAPLGFNRLDFRMGPILLYQLGVFALPLENLMMDARVVGEKRQKATFYGVGEIEHSGGHQLSGEIGLAYKFNETIRFGIQGRLPFYRNVAGQQIVESYAFGSSLSIHLDKASEEEDVKIDSHHDAHKHVSKTPPIVDPDIADSATNGESFKIADVVVPGKITVIDFWAQWCESCHTLTGYLKSLAGQLGILAIRRVEVTTEDCALAKEHLGENIILPTVWVYGTNGKKLGALVGKSADETYHFVKSLVEANSPK